MIETAEKDKQIMITKFLKYVNKNRFD